MHRCYNLSSAPRAVAKRNVYINNDRALMARVPVAFFIDTLKIDLLRRKCAVIKKLTVAFIVNF